MTKIITYPNPDISKQEVTYLSQDEAAGVTTLNVENTADFASNDYIVVEQVGNELCEMKQIDTIVSATSMSTLSITAFPHGTGIEIRKTLFNQARLYRSADNVTYNMIQTQDIDWQDKYGLINFIDPTGSDDYWYKVEYYNSTTTDSYMSSPIKTPTQFGYMTVEEFMNETGIKGDPNTIAHALNYGAEAIYRKLYTGRQYEAAVTPGTEFSIPTDSTGEFGSGLEFADANLDGKIDKDDFLAYEEDTDGVRTYVTSDIASVDVDRHLVTFNSPHPAANKKLIFEYQLTYRKLTELSEALRRLNMLYAVNYIFRSIPFKRLQRGIGGWTINGVSVDFQMGMLMDVVKQNEKEILDIISMMGRIYTRKTQLRYPSGKPLSWIKSTLNWTSDNVPNP